MSLQKLLLISLVLLAVLLLSARLPLTYNLRNLVVRWRITALTALAFTLVVALLTVMLAFVNGMYRLTQASGIPGNVIILSDGATDELFSNLAYRDSSNVEYGKDSPVLRDEQGQPMVSREVYLVVNQPLPPVAGERKKRRFLQVRGIDDPVMSGRVHGLELYPGGAWFSPAGVETSADKPEEQVIQAVLGEGIAQELGRDRGKDRLTVGDHFEVGGRQWVVSGVLRSFGTTFGSEIWAKRALVGPMFGKEAMHTTIVLRTGSAADAKALAQDLTKTYKKAAVQAQPEDEYYARLSATNKQFLYAIIFVAIIMAAGGVFGGRSGRLLCVGCAAQQRSGDHTAQHHGVPPLSFVGLGITKNRRKPSVSPRRSSQIPAPARRVARRLVGQGCRRGRLWMRRGGGRFSCRMGKIKAPPAKIARRRLISCDAEKITSSSRSPSYRRPCRRPSWPGTLSRRRNQISLQQP